MSVTQILVVDDFQPWQRCISQMFESEPDLKISSVASDGFEAVQKAKELQPDVILMDVSPPGMNGFEATRQIRVFSPGSKILFLSEHRGSDLIQAAFDVGGFGYVLNDRQFVSNSLKELVPKSRLYTLEIPCLERRSAILMTRCSDRGRDRPQSTGPRSERRPAVGDVFFLDFYLYRTYQALTLIRLGSDEFTYREKSMQKYLLCLLFYVGRLKPLWALYDLKID